MMQAGAIYGLKGVVQFYNWGGYEFIPTLLGEKNEGNKPHAEYWLGAHGSASAQLTNSPGDLKTLIANDGEKLLGASIYQTYGGLPYLLKLLDVRQMLSIQVHPSREGARVGFEEENRKGIPLDAAGRSYRDQNHKPEMMVALSDFWLLHGFKSAVNLGMIFEATPELKPLHSLFEAKGYEGLFHFAMTADQQTVNSYLQPLLSRILPLYENGELEKEEEDFWAARAALNFSSQGQIDRGIFSIYFFNLVYLRKGEGIYQPAGLPHAYLEGQNIEVMANSDNVLRAGLTDKHIDVAEVMKHIAFEPVMPQILQGGPRGHRVYETPASEFELHHYELAEGETLALTTDSAETFLLLEGALSLRAGEDALDLQSGAAFLAAANSALALEVKAPSSLFRVTTPAGIKNRAE